MNCATHPEAAAAAYCRECGRPLCEQCRRPALGSIFCDEHLPAAPEPEPSSIPPVSFLPPLGAHGSPCAGAPPDSGGTGPAAAPAGPSAQTWPPPPDHGPNPALAFALGFIPGVGAIYNGQYAKGLIHAVIFGLLVSIADTSHGPLETVSGIGIAVWIFYMAFEAYHTARNRRRGLPVEEFSGFDFGSPAAGGRAPSRLPGGPLILIGVGTLLLLDTTGILSFDELGRYWPVALIALGFYLLFERLSAERGRREAGR